MVRSHVRNYILTINITLQYNNIINNNEIRDTMHNAHRYYYKFYKGSMSFIEIYAYSCIKNHQ